jgi:acetate---CoA ligase (ADP-forming)
VDVNAYPREHLLRRGINVLPSLELAIPALRNALWWARNRERVAAGVARPLHAPVAGKALPRGPWSELAARELLAASGVPLIPAERARSAAEAVRAAQRLGMPVAVKILSPDITHKSDIGGVALGLGSPGEVRAAYERVVAAAAAVPGTRVDGVLVTPMRAGGTELLAGVTIDPTFGPVLTVGLGGLWVEILRDTSLRVLPVDSSEVRRMLDELRGAPLLRGARGARPADLGRVADAICALGNAALSLGGSLRALEVNPLWVSGDRVEAMDALVVT